MRATLSATSAGGAITVSGTLGVTTSGASAYGAWAQSAGSTIALNGPSTFTINGAAFALNATAGGVITTASTLGATINGGAGSGGVQASGSGSTVTLSGATTIGLNGASNTGLLAATGGAITNSSSNLDHRFRRLFHRGAGERRHGHGDGGAQRDDFAGVIRGLRARAGLRRRSSPPEEER